MCNLTTSYLLLSAIVQGVLGTGRIEGPYALDDGRKKTLSEQLLAYCSLNEKVGEESDRCEQNVNKQLLADSAAYFLVSKIL